MKKSTKLSALVVAAVAALGLPLVGSAKTMSATDVQDLTKSASGKARTAYVFGKHVYVNSITTAQLVEAAGTLDGETNPVLYYVNSTGTWTNAVTNDTVSATSLEFNIVKAANVAETVVNNEATEDGVTKEDATTLSFDDDETVAYAIGSVRLAAATSDLLESGAYVKTAAYNYNQENLTLSFKNGAIKITENSPLLLETGKDATGTSGYYYLLVKLNKAVEYTKVEVAYDGGANVLTAAEFKKAATYGATGNEYYIKVPVNATKLVLTDKTGAAPVTTDYKITYTPVTVLKDVTSAAFAKEATTVTFDGTDVKYAQIKLYDEKYTQLYYTSVAAEDLETSYSFTEDGVEKVIKNTGAAWDIFSKIAFNTEKSITLNGTKNATTGEMVYDGANINNKNVTISTVASSETGIDYVTTIKVNKALDTSKKIVLAMNLSTVGKNLSVKSTNTSLAPEKNLSGVNTSDFTYELNALNINTSKSATATVTFTNTKIGTGETADKVVVKFVVEKDITETAIESVSKANNNITLDGTNNTAYYSYNMNSLDNVKLAYDEEKDIYTITGQASKTLSALKNSLGNTGKYVALVLNLNFEAQTTSSTNVVTSNVAVDPSADIVLQNSAANIKTVNDDFGGNSKSIVVWVNAAAEESDPDMVFTLTNVETGDKTTVKVVISEISEEPIYATTNALAGGTALTSVTILSDYTDVVTLSSDGTKFVANKGVSSFEVKAGSGSSLKYYTFYRYNAKSQPSDPDDWKWTATESLRLVSAKNDLVQTGSSDNEKYNIASVENVTYTANTINVDLNREIAGNNFDLVLDFGVKVSELADAAGQTKLTLANVDKHVGGITTATADDLHYLVVTLDTVDTSTDDGQTITVTYNGYDFKFVVKSTVLDNATDLSLISANKMTYAIESSEVNGYDTAVKNNNGITPNIDNDAIVISYNNDLGSYKYLSTDENSAKWVGVLVDLGQKVKAGAVTATKFGTNTNNTTDAIVDYDRASKLGATSDTEFVLWIKADSALLAKITDDDSNDLYEKGLVITFKNATEENLYNTLDVVVAIEDERVNLTMNAPVLASANTDVGVYASAYKNNQEALKLIYSDAVESGDNTTYTLNITTATNKSLVGYGTNNKEYAILVFDLGEETVAETTGLAKFTALTDSKNANTGFTADTFNVSGNQVAYLVELSETINDSLVFTNSYNAKTVTVTVNYTAPTV